MEYQHAQLQTLPFVTGCGLIEASAFIFADAYLIARYLLRSVCAQSLRLGAYTHAYAQGLRSDAYAYAYAQGLRSGTYTYTYAQATCALIQHLSNP